MSCPNFNFSPVSFDLLYMFLDKHSMDDPSRVILESTECNNFTIKLSCFSRNSTKKIFYHALNIVQCLQQIIHEVEAFT